MSLILCIETGTDTCSVGLAQNGALVALRESSEERDHARRVAVYTDEILQGHGIDARGLDAVAVSKGPGSYTGLRIGVSFAKGLCYGLSIPLIGVGSLDSLAHSAIESHEARAVKAADWERAVLVPMIDARRMEVFGQVFDTAGNALSDAEAWIIDENSLSDFRDDREVLIFGSGAEKCREALPWARFVEIAPSARGMVGLAGAAFEAGNFEDTAYFEPFYLKDFIVTTSKKKLF
jgi:tRNA threonylcarbamoyladenosine biosynthesis protein TsaB